MSSALTVERGASAPSRSSPVHAALAAMSLAAAGIHFAVIGEHLQLYFLFGLFFSVVAWLQALWAVAVVRWPARWILASGLIGNLAIVMIWAVSRTAGLPIGPEPGAAEAASFIDILSTVLEVLIVVGCGALLARPERVASLASRAGWVATLVVVLVLVPLTTASIDAATQPANGGEGHSGGGTNEAGGDQPGFARVDLGQGRVLQALIDSQGSGPAQVHLTFFDAAGGPLDVASVTLDGTPPSGPAVDVPVSKFETGHYAATTELAKGTWTFRVDALASGGEQISTTFRVDVGNRAPVTVG